MQSCTRRNSENRPAQHLLPCPTFGVGTEQIRCNQLPWLQAQQPTLHESPRRSEAKGHAAITQSWPCTYDDDRSKRVQMPSLYKRTRVEGSRLPASRPSAEAER